MRKVKKYILITKNYSGDLTAEVNRFLADGYVLHGDPFSGGNDNNYTYSQAVIKYRTDRVK